MNDSGILEATRLEESERDFEGAIAFLERLIAQDPTYVEAYVHLAADSGILYRFPQAEQYARKALAIDPTSGRARYYLACALRDEGRLDEAYTEMEQALVQVRQAAVKGTLAERNWQRFPLFGWNRYVEEDTFKLRAQIADRDFGIFRKKIGLKWSAFFGSVGITEKKDKKTGRMKTCRSERHGFKIDVPEAWLPPEITPDGPAFNCGREEAFSFKIGPITYVPDLDITEDNFSRQAHANGYTEVAFGRIPVGGKEHVWIRFRLGNGQWAKKYLLVLGGKVFAITGSWHEQATFAQREAVWDTIVKSFRLTR
jgi:hypothetical protein